MAHPDETVKVKKEVPSQAIAEAVLRHDNAKSDDATEQEKKQAAVEKAHALSTRPNGSFAQLHEVEEATLAVADGGEVKSLKTEQREAVKARDEAPASAASAK